MGQQTNKTALIRRAVVAAAVLLAAAGSAELAAAGVGSFGRSQTAAPAQEPMADAPSESKAISLSESKPAAKASSPKAPPKKAASAPASRVKSWSRTDAVAAVPVAPPAVELQEAPERPAGGDGEGEVEVLEGTESAAFVPVPYLVPGSGFSGPTPDPLRIGDLSAPGANAKAIAHWNVVPKQLILGDYQVGVVAFHINEIDRVEFSLNGGPWLAARSMRENKITGTWEYMVRLTTSTLPDGPFELRAIAYPRTGQPRLLEPLTLIANRGGSVPQGAYYVSPTGNDESGDGSKLRPFRTIYHAARKIALEQGGPYYASNSAVLLLAGDHTFAGRPQGNPRIETEMGWLTIQPAPGLSKERVRIVGNSASYGGLCASHVRFRQLTVVGTSLKTDRANNPAAWFDRCDLLGSGGTDATQFAPPSSWTGGVYFTQSLIKDVANGPSGSTFVRGCTLENIGSDALQNPRLVIDTKVNNLRPPPGVNYHPDLLQFHGDFDNVIIYGLTAREIHGQGIFSRGLGDPGEVNGIRDKNLAFVNVAIDQRSHFSQWIQSSDHVLFWNVTMLGRAFLIRHDPTGITNIQRNFSMRNSVMQDLRVTGGIDPSAHATAFQNNHFIEGRAYGTNATSGPAQLLTIHSQHPFVPAPSSPLLSRVTRPLVPTDANGESRGAPSAIGAAERID